MGNTVSSLAGTGRDYAVIQGRVDGTQLKIQGAGPEVNRGYGLSIIVPIPAELATWMSGIKATIKSLANSGQRYFAMQAAELDYSDFKVRVQVAGTKLNRSYGAVFSVADEGLADFVSQVLEVEEDDEDYDEFEEEEDAIVEMI